MTESEPKPLQHQSPSSPFVLVVVLVFTIVALLIAGNVVVIFIADSFNDQACHRAADAVRRAVENKMTSDAVFNAAQDSIVRLAAFDSYMDGPNCVECAEEPSHVGTIWKVTTQLSVRLPAPYLVLDGDVRREGKMSFSKTYLVRMKG